MRLRFSAGVSFACLFLLITAIVAGAKASPACDCCPTGKKSASAPTSTTSPTEGEASCKFCGMDRAKFAHSRMLVEYEDGTSASTCSIHCLAVEMANSIDKSPRAIRVGDYGTKQLIDTETATWVIGGGKTGVMSIRAKWAFGKKGDAEAFIAANGGSLATFEDALKAAYEDLYKDTRMIRERRKMMKMKKMEQK